MIKINHLSLKTIWEVLDMQQKLKRLLKLWCDFIFIAHKKAEDRR